MDSHAHQARPCLVTKTQTACAALSILAGLVLSQTHCWRSLTLIIVTLGRLHPCPPCKRVQTHLDLLYESLKTQEWHFTNLNGITSLIFQHWEKKKCLDYNTLHSSQTERSRERGVECRLWSVCASCFRCHIQQLLLCCCTEEEIFICALCTMSPVTCGPPPESSNKGRRENKHKLCRGPGQCVWAVIEIDEQWDEMIVYP